MTKHSATTVATAELTEESAHFMRSTAAGDGHSSGPAASRTPVESPVRGCGRNTPAELVATVGDDATTAAFTLPSPPVAADDARRWTAVAIGAVNRRDLPLAVAAAQRIVLGLDSIAISVGVLSGILLTGLPRGGLAHGSRIAVEVAGTEEGQSRPLPMQAASDLLTGIASGSEELTASAFRVLEGPGGVDVLIALVQAAADRIENFVGLDGDTVDAFYSEARERARGRDHDDLCSRSPDARFHS